MMVANHLDRKINAINRTNWVCGYLEKDTDGQVIGVCIPLFLVITSADAQIFTGGQRNILITRQETQISTTTLGIYCIKVNGHCRG